MGTAQRDRKWIHSKGSGVVRSFKGGQDWVDVPKGSVGPQTVNDQGGYRLNGSGKVYLFFWGEAWRGNPSPNPSAQDLVNAFAAVLASPYQSALEQYGCSMLSFGGAYYTTGGIDPPGTFHDVDVQTRMMEIIDFNYNIPASKDDLYVLVTGPGAQYSDPNFTGKHANFADIRAFEYINYAWVQFDTLENMTVVFSHELVEAITDPHGDAIQIDPIDGSDWHEIGDVCEGNSDYVNGIKVEAYWSKRDNACVIPQDVPVHNRQVTCIKKGPYVDSPKDRIKAVGGISVESGESYYVTQERCIRDIDAGMRYFVVGNDGSRADVRVNIHFPPWAPQGSRYIATVADDSKEDNLLSLPQCKEAARVAQN
jgi:hypothetical protein